MNNTLSNLSAEQIAAQFEVKPLEARLETVMPYGRDREQPAPSVPGGY